MKHILTFAALVFATLIFDSGLTCFGQIESVCGCADETDLNDETIFSLTAPQGFKLGPVLFASYGTPVGDCDGLLGYGGCHSENSIEIIENLITENDSTISIYPNNNTFADPCAGIVKRLCVRIGLLQLGPLGCTDIESCNFDEQAVYDDGSCISCDLFAERCLDGTVWDEELRGCVVASASDTDFDGCVGMTDLLDLLSVFGTCNETPWSCGDQLEYQGYDYETVQIGEHCWFAENLRSEHYENGDTVPTALNDEEWSSTTSGAMAVYGEGSSSCNTQSPDGDACDPNWSLAEYGRLYNWHAVNDTRGLCPSGWHVSTDEEWTVMTDELGGLAVAGGEIKATYGWHDGGNGTNSSGFAGRPGGYRRDDGDFRSAGIDAGWWSPSLSSTANEDKWFRDLDSSNGGVYRNATNPRHGFSIRCIKDSE